MEKTINGRKYVLGSIKTKVGRKLKDQYPDQGDHNVALIAASLQAGGMEEATPAWVDENVDWADFNALIIASYEASGFKSETPKVGEDQPSGETAQA